LAERVETIDDYGSEGSVAHVVRHRLTSIGMGSYSLS